jgi:hypothetical protein
VKPRPIHIVIGTLAFAAGFMYVGMVGVAQMLKDD